MKLLSVLFVRLKICICVYGKQKNFIIVPVYKYYQELQISILITKKWIHICMTNGRK